MTPESTTTHDMLGFHSSANGSSLIGAIVAGNIIAVTPAPNTKINLAGIGYVFLNEQIAKHTATSSSLTVNQIHVVVTAANVVINNIKIALGTNIIVSHAVSGLTSGVQGTLDGSAYGTRARIGNLLASGPTAQISLGCLGTKEVLKQNEILQVQVPNVFAVGEVVDTAQGSTSASVAMGETTSTVQAVDVLAGLVTADLVKADAHSMKNGGAYSQR